MDKFTRTQKLTKIKSIPYNSDVPKDKLYNILTACHWGSLKLFYSEFEFLTIVSKYIDLSTCLIVYIGAQPGWRIKAMYVNIFFPTTKWLLYDPLPFEIQSSDSIIIKTNADGYFSDDKINEVKMIANGRKIILINDMRFSDPGTVRKSTGDFDVDNVQREAAIYRDLIRQQRWGITLGAEFMLLKFRMFYFQYNFREINFINNKAALNDIKNNVIFNKHNKKHKSKHRFMLYFAGKIYTQVFAHKRSTEARLFVKKLKYYKNLSSFSPNDLEKYKLKYYDNILYDGCFNYFNQNVRYEPSEYKQSNELLKYVPGRKNTFEFVSEYYMIHHYLKCTKQETSMANILKNYIIIHQTIGKRYNKNVVKCHLLHHFVQVTSFKHAQTYIDELYAYIAEKLKEFVEMSNNQFQNLVRSNFISADAINAFVKLHNAKEHNFTINNGQITITSFDIATNKKYKNQDDRIEI